MKLVIFDMDGLMFDTGLLAYRAYQKSAIEHNYEVNPNVYYFLTGRDETSIREGMKDLYGSEAPVDIWRDTVNLNKKKILLEEKRVYKKQGLLELLNYLKENDYLIALASSSSRSTISLYLELEEVNSYFDVIVAGDEIKQSKPNPEIFLTACQKLSVLPKDALVLEDSLAGIESASRAKIPSILIEDDITDLEAIEGKYKLKKEINIEDLRQYQPTYRFKNLLEVKRFLEGL